MRDLDSKKIQSSEDMTQGFADNIVGNLTLHHQIVQAAVQELGEDLYGGDILMRKVFEEWSYPQISSSLFGRSQ